MKEETTAKDIQSLVEDSTPDLLIISANLLAHPDSRLDTMDKKFHPLNDESIPYRDMFDASTKKESIHRLIERLDVTKSLRYQRTLEDTYCNVYSYDFCYFSKVYLPTVWWTIFLC